MGFLTDCVIAVVVFGLCLMAVHSFIEGLNLIEEDESLGKFGIAGGFFLLVFAVGLINQL